MDTALKPLWIVILALLIIATDTYALECKDIDRTKCLCFRSDYIDVLCPATDNQISLSVTKQNHITLQCLQPYVNLDIIPDLDLSNTTVFKMEFCYLNTSFTDIMKKFNVQNLNTLMFESMDQVNKITTLTKESFESLQDLESLMLSYSTFRLAKDFLANTPNLLKLSLTKNQIDNLDDFFRYVPKLKMLELSGNQISVLPDGIFQSLSNLTRLYLFNNNLTSLSRNTFMGLKSLKVLELSNNHIEELSEDAFAGLHNLVNISLRGNRIGKIHNRHFVNSTQLQNIRLGMNRGLILSEHVFANLTALRTVELFLNNMEAIPEDTFLNCANLEEITLKSNLLTSLPQKIFKDLKKLKSLNLSRNKLNTISDEVFSSLEKLEQLDLSNNQLTVISEDLFKYLDGLKRLELQRNKISVIKMGAFSAFQNELTYLDLSFNEWNNSNYFSQLPDPTTPLNPLLKVEELIISHNLIEDIPDLPSSLALRKMDLSYNRIDELPIAYFTHSTRFTFEVDLENNKIEQINFHLAESLSKENSVNYDALHNTGASIVLKVANNPIACDCSNYDLVRYNDDEMKELKTLVDIVQDGLVCSNDNITQVADLRPSDIDCPVIDGCPGPCKCSYKPYNTAIIVDCSHNNLSSYPTFDMPIDGHSYTQTFLILTGNYLTSGPSPREANYSNITNLDLSGNMISSIDWIPPKIRDLNLNDNRIKNLDKHFIEKLKNATSLERLHLRGNPWECSCKSLDLQKYLMQYYHKVNSSDVYCHKAHAQLVKLTDICKVSPYLSILLPIVLTVFLCFAVTCALYYRYQTEVKVFLFAHKWLSWLVTEEELDKDKTYDVFISYAHQDEQFVVEQLLSKLEHGERPFKVCIHIRDWIPGEFISEQIVNSVRDSRRTLVVLSNNFVDSVWGKMEFRTAHTEAMSEGRARVIVLIYGDLDESKLGDELKSYLKTNTYVKWGDKYFWNKLRYALPHRRHFYENNKKHARVMLKIDDKFDLIKNPPSPTNTSTPPITLDPSLLESKELKIDMPRKIEGETPLLFR